MKIVRIESWREHVPLSRPYDIASFHTDAVELCFVRIVTDGTSFGIGAATPAEEITGESVDVCAAALDPEALGFLIGRDPRALGACCSAAERMRATPAARAAVDTALHDLCARLLDVPLVELLGGCLHEPLETSITIGIQSTEDTLAEAEEYLGRGFRRLKVKIGADFEADVERLRLLREVVDSGVTLRVDANEGYDLEQTRGLAKLLDELDLELIEQPVSAKLAPRLRELRASVRERIALDESVFDARDALELARPPEPAGTWVLKLMKSGGVRPCLDIARIAEASGRALMWGCMDESRVSIAAALHAAYASRATRFLDLDGHLDLERDPARGGFELEDGRLTLTGAAGLGVTLAE